MVSRNVFNLGATEVVAFSTSAAASTINPARSRPVLVTADADCFVNMTTTATVTNSAYLPAKTSVLLSVPAGSALSFIGTGAGKAYVTDVMFSS